MIPITVIVATRNEEERIAACLKALQDFGEIIVQDSNSTDRTCEIAEAHGARVVNFTWNGQYPKKRQWCLDVLETKYDWLFFVDADEILTPELIREIENTLASDNHADGYFVKGRYVVQDKPMRFGLQNNKLCLFDRHKFRFPVVDDLDLQGMGELEGHYQPVAIDGGRIGQMKTPLLHYADNEDGSWEERHQRYAAWERGVNARNAWPVDPDPKRQKLKELFRRAPLRPLIAFLHCYIYKLGVLDGAAGFKLAAQRYKYYRMIGR